MILTFINNSVQNRYSHFLLFFRTFLYEFNYNCILFVFDKPGYCPIYNYGSRYATYHSCSDFTSGCPTAMFHSKNVYQRKWTLVLLVISFWLDGYEWIKNTYCDRKVYYAIALYLRYGTIMLSVIGYRILIVKHICLDLVLYSLFFNLYADLGVK